MSGRNVMTPAHDRAPGDFGESREHACQWIGGWSCWDDANAIINRTAHRSNRNSINDLCDQDGKRALANRANHRERSHTAHPGGRSRSALDCEATGPKNWPKIGDLDVRPHDFQSSNFWVGWNFSGQGDFR